MQLLTPNPQQQHPKLSSMHLGCCSTAVSYLEGIPGRKLQRLTIRDRKAIREGLHICPEGLLTEGLSPVMRRW